MCVASFQPRFGRLRSSWWRAHFFAEAGGDQPRRDRFGAVPNDGNDDAAAIQRAIDASAAGDTVRLPGGTFLVSRALRLKTGVKITGCGRGRTILKCHAESPLDFFDLSGTRNVELSHFTIDGGDSVNARLRNSACAGGGHHIHHLAIHNLGGDGALGIHFGGRDGDYVHGVCDCLIADNMICNIGLDSAWGGGIRLSWGGSRNQVLRNVVDNTGRGGIFADNGSSDLVIRHNTVTRSGRKAEKLGLEIWKDCDRVVIEDNAVDHWLSVGGAARVAVRRNTIRDKTGDVGFLGLEIIGQDIVASDNLVDDGQQIGISVSNDCHNQYQYCATQYGPEHGPVGGPGPRRQGRRTDALLLQERVFDDPAGKFRGHLSPRRRTRIPL